MSELDWEAWIERSPSLSKITPAALALTLKGFPLEPRPGMAWLARALQGAMLFTGPLLPELRRPETGDPVLLNMGTPTEQRDNYKKLATDTAKLAAAYRNNANLLQHGRVSSIQFDALAGQLSEAATALECAARAAKGARQRFRNARARDDRKDCARAIAPIFRMAFDCEPAWNDWPGMDGGPWADFFQRVMALAFDEKKTPNLRRVLKDARRIEWTEDSFAPGQLPEYPL